MAFRSNWAAAVSAPPAAKSSRIPKIAMVAFVALVASIAGVTYGVHRARPKAAQVEAHAKIQRSLAELSAATEAANSGASQSAVGNLQKKLAALAVVQDANTQAALQDLREKVSDLSVAAQAGQNRINAATPTHINGDLAAVAGAIDAVAQSRVPTLEATSSTTLANPSPAAPVIPSAKPISTVPVAATGDQARDWALKYERTEGGPEADLVARTGDVNNLGFGWTYYDRATKQKKTFDPFSGRSTDPHPWPSKPPADEPEGTDRILLASVVTPDDWHKKGGDGYSGTVMSACYWASQGRPLIEGSKPVTCDRQAAIPVPISITVGTLPTVINAVLFQMFVDDFQPQVMNSHFQVSLNGTRIPSFEYAINSLDQSGPIGKLITIRLLPEYWPLLKSGTVKLLIDDPTTHVPDGYAIDFVRILVNPHQPRYQVSLSATVSDADKHTPIVGASVNAALQSAATDSTGKCELTGIPAGLVVATASAPGYDESSAPVDLVAGQNGNAEIQLHRHQETIAALEQSIAQTGSATLYGIHFDTDSAKLRPDSLPALNAVLGLINKHPGSRWTIAGHTDNQGGAGHNQTLSEARADSVVTWLKAHRVASAQLVSQGFGTSQPVADNATANGRALNRRVEVSLAK